MSIRVMNKVFENNTLTTGEKFVLVVLADFGNDEGRSIYPSQATIARKTNMQRTSETRILKTLEENGYIRKTNRRPSGVYEMEIVLETLEEEVLPKDTPDVTVEHTHDDSMSPTVTQDVAVEHTINELSVSNDINSEINLKDTSASPSVREPDFLDGMIAFEQDKISREQRLEMLLDNLYDYPDEIQPVLIAFGRRWKKPPPPKNSKYFAKWIKDGREILTLLQNAQLSADEVFAEAYYDWKTPPSFLDIQRNEYEGNYTIYDLGSAHKLVWEAITRIVTGERKRRVKVYKDANGNPVEVEQ